ncbi:MAG: exonuclease, partial [Nitrosopumilaceae archaeon]|nr:YqaJ viral recombinase family protein [Nitrosopumilaceae archaeon]NIX60157.1 exonuclease [Nitrosopumilaceae archaeon]
QGTQGWFDLKIGKPSASNFDKIITPSGGPSKQQEKYMYQLAGEIITQKKEETYKSHAMEEGNIKEAEARALYEMLYDVDVLQTGVCYKDDEKAFLCSPDGLVEVEGMLEIKCPLIHTHVGYLLKDELPREYFCQVQGQMYVTDRKWCDFMSYYPAMPPLIIRV